jgi:hypothetical protein
LAGFRQQRIRFTTSSNSTHSSIRLAGDPDTAVPTAASHQATRLLDRGRLPDHREGVTDHVRRSGLGQKPGP